MGQTTSSNNGERLISSKLPAAAAAANGLSDRVNKRNGKASLQSELDNVSTGSGEESNEDVVHALEGAIGNDPQRDRNIKQQSTKSGKTGLSEDEEKKLRDQLQKIEDDIAMYRQSLHSRTLYANELKRRLGYSVWDEISDDVSKGFRNIKESQAYQRTGEIVHQASDRLSRSFSQLRNTPTVKSVEAKIETAYSGIKVKFPKASFNVQKSNNSTKSDEEPILSND